MRRIRLDTWRTFAWYCVIGLLLAGVCLLIGSVA